VALELPAPVVDVLGAWQATTIAGRDALRPIDRAALHLTLCFLGLRDAAELPMIERACAAAERMPAGGLALGEPIWLPRRRPGVLAIAVADDHGELRAIQSVLAGALTAAGVFEDEGRIFFPHVTVARVRTGSRPRAARLAPPVALEFSGETVALLRSHLAAGPASYEALHRVPLA